MSTLTETTPWLARALELSNSLAHNHDTSRRDQYAVQTHPSPPSRPAVADHTNISTDDFGAPSKSGLGDFSKIWQALGNPRDSPVPASSPSVLPLVANKTSVFDSLPTKIDYTSDGATYVRSAKGGKKVAWQDEASADDTAPDTTTDRSVSPEQPTPALTKKQLKRQKQKERKAKEAADELKNAIVSESEADTVTRRTPARKASTHFVAASEPMKRYNLRERDASGKALLPQSTQDSMQLATAKVAEKLAELKNTSKNTAATSQANTRAKTTRPHQVASTIRQLSQPLSSPARPTTSNGQPVQAAQWPVTSTRSAQALQFVPSSVKPYSQQPSSNAKGNTSLVPESSSTPKKSRHVIEPKIVRSGEDRHWALLMKLIGGFFEDRKYIIAPMNLTTHNNDPTGIHVFVDASNIFIGFTDQLKRSRNIPASAHVPQVNLSFDALALLMERRRPVCKRVLVGSTPHMPAFDKAKDVGYECSILEKVYKARELTERQIYFQGREKYGRVKNGGKEAKAPPANQVTIPSGSLNAGGMINRAVGGNVNGGYTSGGSETASASIPQYAPARMIEQGVDEILHLKILESVVDTEVPSTIVLGTGDAAQAEYSSGFMAMVERALKKGWKVELVSWSKNISQMYLNARWQAQWQGRFKVVFLDDYAEELLEM
ncbi:hypothetical protein Tdes44962_MAKER03369 [Teratosphaeria destructans]|uniref:NYN domain-containing protein n=1 Tax=Teratosphaeria destructans TaxID=418781 RepID=A0A9W7SQ24_9PEZI|nr:hypothetical protein Tdes44962_MAKER03369 [Teratosphaeria destructans]